MDNAIDLLKTDHQTVRGLLKQLDETSERAVKGREDLLERIGRELRAHGRIEEEIFYPALRQAAESKHDKEVLKMVAEAYEEHRAAVQLVLGDLDGTDPESIQFSGRAKVLKELIEHHADEEEKEMFKAAKRLLEKERLVELGDEMAQRKQEILAHGKSSKPKRSAAARAPAVGKAAAADR